MPSMTIRRPGIGLVRRPRENLSSTFDADLEAWRPASPVFLSQRLHTRSVLRLVAGLTPRAGVRVCSYSLHHKGTTEGIIRHIAN